MKILTTLQAILFGLGLSALAIASFPYSSNIMIKQAKADYVFSDKISIFAWSFSLGKVEYLWGGLWKWFKYESCELNSE